MSEQAQVGRWRFESEHGLLIVYQGGEKIAQFVGGVFETEDARVAEALRGDLEYCHEVALPALPVVSDEGHEGQAAVTVSRGR